MGGVKVLGFIKGVTPWGDQGKLLYVVIEHKGNNDDGEGLDWYLQALEIVQETIDWVLAQPDAQEYYLIWSA